MAEISSSEYNEWLQSDVTKAVFEELRREEEALSTPLSQGAYADDPNERLYMGYVRAIRAVIDPENLREGIVMEESDE